ncbi:hypothetical protein [Pseudogracilibacillus auburnensis]|uniref:hypothetical protein n=1 Tax=Pseudogracilibacillus auburnensis TaxID=1494959 RepID=UPI001A96FA26|nr:hypothetical protein [Pseudogracilibacillus auburnensis]MBO1001784.1 hypothetical protein [Pseudogracilibacillus auburnensis]
MQGKSKWKDPGIILCGVLLLVAAIVLIWWPKDVYIMGISLAGWLMFSTYFIWLLIGVIYIFWIEKWEKK